MSFLIAVTGKGGVGKTTITGLLINRLLAHKRGPVLAVDADPNSCLNTVLGVTVENTVGRVREEVREESSKGKVTGVSKQQMLEMKIEECLVEATDFDLIAMGRSEGPGCYCYANNVLKEVIKKLSRQYPYVVIDNEAGLENLSRRIVQKVNLLVMVADSTQNGLETVRRLYQLAKEMKIDYEQVAVVINRTDKDHAPAEARDLGRDIKADYFIMLPYDRAILALSEKGSAVSGLPADNAVLTAMDDFIKKV